MIISRQISYQMKKRFSLLMLNMGLLLVCIFFETHVRAQSTLTQIPLHINLGVTKYNELVTAGFEVESMNKPASGTSRYIRYNLDSSRFYAHIDFDNIINRISYHAVAHHKIPNSWKKIGIRLASNYRYVKIRQANNLPKRNMVPENGNSITEFLSIINSQKVSNIKRTIAYKSDYQVEETISFEIERYIFEAAFVKWVKPSWCKDCDSFTDYDNGLISIEMSIKN